MAFRKELIDFWARHVADPAYGPVHSTYKEQIKALFEQGISMDDAIHFVYTYNPDKDAFVHWVEQRRRPQEIFDPAAIQDVLTADDIEFWNTQGYVVLKGVVSEEKCAAARDAIWEHIGIAPDDREAWYAHFESKRGLMIQFSDHPALDALRNSPEIYKAFYQLYGHSRIYKTIDKVSFNPPENENHTFLGSSLHWDTSLRLPVADEFQGLLYLTDTSALDGAFHCVPGFHRKLESWMNALPPDTNPREEALRSLQAVAVPGMAGDFVIWHQALPHCATPNKGKTPRLVQYLTYLSEDVEPSNTWI